MTSNTQENTVLGFTKALIWPIVTLILIAIFWVPLHAIVAFIPEVLEKSDTITLGNELKLEVGGRLSDRVTPAVREILAKLDSDDVKTILSNNPNSTAFFISDVGDVPPPEDSDVAKEIQGWRDIVQVGLARELSKEELRTQGQKNKEKYTAGFEPTDNFAVVREVLIGLTAELIKPPKAVSVPRSNAK